MGGRMLSENGWLNFLFNTVKTPLLKNWKESCGLKVAWHTTEICSIQM